MSVSPPAVDVIVPVLNEEQLLPDFLARVRRLPLPLRLVFVDNASTDRTVEILGVLPDITLVQHQRNEGYGGSILDGIARSTADALVIIDADCEYPPEAIPDLVRELERHEAVYASRFLDPRELHMPWLRRIGNRTITTLYNLLFNQRLTDLYTGCKALRRSAVDGMVLERKGFEHVLELGVKLSRRGIRIAEIPVAYAPRQGGASKMRHLSETMKFFLLLIRYRLFG